MPHGLEYVLQASDEPEMNEWVTLINWSAASKTLGITTTSNDSLSSGLWSSDGGEKQNLIMGTIKSQRSIGAESSVAQDHLPEPSTPFAGILSLNPANKVTVLHTGKGVDLETNVPRSHSCRTMTNDLPRSQARFKRSCDWQGI
jgi:hypothetical protein